MSVSLPQPANQEISRTLPPKLNRQLTPNDQQNVSGGCYVSSADNHHHFEIAHDTLSDYGGDSGFGMSSSSRRMREFMPESKKDNEYWMKRQKNNEAAKRSREKRRANDAVMAHRIHELSSENKRLKLELIAIRRQFGLVPGSYVMPPEPLASSSDDGHSSPQSRGTTPYDLPAEVLQPTVSYSRQPSGVEEPQLCRKHVRDSHFVVQPDCETASLDNLVGCDDEKKTFVRSGTATLHHSSTGLQGGKVAEVCLDYGEMVGLLSNITTTSSECTNSSYAIVDRVDQSFARDCRPKLPSSAMESSRSNDTFSLSYSDVPSSDDSDCYDVDSSGHLSSVKITMGGSLYRKKVSRHQVGCSSTGEVPLNLSAVPCRAQCSSQQNVRLQTDVGLHYPSRLWRGRSVSPNCLKQGTQGLPSSVTNTSGVDMSNELRFMRVNDMRPNGNKASLEKPKLFSNEHTITSGLRVELIKAAMEINSASDSLDALPPVEAFCSSARLSVEVPDYSGSISSVNNVQPPHDEFSFCQSRQMRRGVPLKVWRKLAASHDECDGRQTPATGEERGGKMSVSNYIQLTASIDNHPPFDEPNQTAAVLFDSMAPVHKATASSQETKQQEAGTTSSQLGHYLPSHSVGSSSASGSYLQTPNCNVESRVVR